MAGPVFALGWLMAQLFDERRLEVDSAMQQPPFDSTSQLPLITELDKGARRNRAVTELGKLLELCALGLTSEAIAAQAQPFSQDGIKAAVNELHLQIYEKISGSRDQLSAYQLGLALSDTCWLPSAEGGPDSLMRMFQRGQVASLRTWLAAAGSQLPDQAAATLSQSLENWQIWIDVNAMSIKAAQPVNTWAKSPEPIIKALRIQAVAWYSLLVSDPKGSGPPGVSAWIQAVTSLVRAGHLLVTAVLRRFWWLALSLAMTTGGLLYLVISSLSGLSEVWTTLATVAGALGLGATGLNTAVSKARHALSSEILSAARMEATAWSVTWLPTLPQTTMQRYQLGARGVVMPQIRKGLD